jgi:hypothetical protein
VEFIMVAKHRVTINLADNEYNELTALSRKNRVSLAWLGRQAIIEFLDRYANEERQLPLNLPGQPRRANG